MENSSSKATFLLYYQKNDGTNKLSVLTKDVYIPNLCFRPTYITIDDITINTEMCEYNVNKNELNFITRIEYDTHELVEYKKKLNKLLEKGFRLEMERGEN